MARPRQADNPDPADPDVQKTEDKSWDPDRGFRVTRRRALGALGVGVAAVSAPGLAAAADRRGSGSQGQGGDDRDGSRPPRSEGERPEGGGSGRPPEPDDGPGQFIRMFEDHPPFVEPDDELTTMLAELGKPGGILDANDPLEVGPTRLITEPELSPNNPDNPNHTAGSTFVGQFLDHDITSDGGSRLGQSESINRSVNLRSARFDLDSVYGGGPDDSPQLYRGDDRYMFRVESGGLFEDLPRDSAGTAIISDARNDENMMISGIQVAFLLFHNQVLNKFVLPEPGMKMRSGKRGGWSAGITNG